MPNMVRICCGDLFLIMLATVLLPRVERAWISRKSAAYRR